MDAATQRTHLAETRINGPVAIAGATGYIGTRLVPRLLTAGHSVRCLVRAPRKLAGRPWVSDPRVEIVTVDLDDAEAVQTALADCSVLYYLVHNMRSAGGGYAERDRTMAGTVSAAARAAGVGRIIYLGGLGSDGGGPLSEHLASRREVERVLVESGVAVTNFRAAMIIGSGSASFEILRYLTERLPVMITPKWVSTPSQPIAVRDVLHYLVACLDGARNHRTHPRDRRPGRALVRRPDPDDGRGTGPAAAADRAGAAVHAASQQAVDPPRDAGRTRRIARPLAEGLRNPVVLTEHAAEALMPQPLLGVKASIELALAAEGRADVESTWTAAGPVPGDPDWAGGKVFEERHERFVAATPIAVFAAVATLGGRRGWYRYNRLWLTRGILDRLVGGPGWQRGRRHPTELAWGDAVGFWRVAGIEPPTWLALRAEMRLPGDAVLEFRMEPATAASGAAGTTVVQTARFRPRGLLGLLYWYGIAPFHGPVFSGLIDGIADAARAPEATAAS